MSGIFGSRTGNLSMKDAQAELERDKGIVLIDVRTVEEYRDSHIKGAINIPLHLVPAMMAEKVPNRKARIFVYCLSGGRSSQAAGWMRQNGYDDVTNIGGITAWRGPLER